MQEYLRRQILAIAHPILKQMGKVGIPDRRVSERFLFCAEKKLIPGHVLLSRKDWEASNILQGDYWKHTAIFVGHNKWGEPIIVEAIGRGVVMTGLAKFLLTKDDVLILQPTFATPIEMKQAAHWALTLIGQPYDYEFTPANPAWYCSEIPWWCYKKSIPDNTWVVRKKLGVETCAPQDYANAVNKWKPFLASKDYENG